MTRKPTGNPTGRPKKEFDHKQFESMCEILCTQEEMASILKMDRDTLALRVKQHYRADFSAVYKRLSDGGRKSLRRSQFHMAQTNPTMSIWLGKQKFWLNQSDRQEIQHTVISKESEIVQE